MLLIHLNSDKTREVDIKEFYEHFLEYDESVGISANRRRLLLNWLPSITAIGVYYIEGEDQYTLVYFDKEFNEARAINLGNTWLEALIVAFINKFSDNNVKG